MLSQTTVFTHLVRDTMRSAPVHCSPDTKCSDVVTRMCESGSSSAVIVNADNRPVGIVTEQDICRRVAFSVSPDTPVHTVMSSVLHTIYQGEFMYRAIAEMRRHKLRHMPATNRQGQIVGMLNLDDALAGAAGQIVRHIEYLSHDYSFEGLCETKSAQKNVALELLDDTVPTPEIQWLLSSINAVIHNRVVEICVDQMIESGWGEPPVEFDVIIMGSGGRGESYLNPDQDNGFVLENHPESKRDQVDRWFLELAERMTVMLNDIGFDFCVGKVMATNPRWRKTVDDYCDQIKEWVLDARGDGLRYCDIFFDYRCCFGKGDLSATLRSFITETATHPRFLSQLYKLDEKHRGALDMFGRLVTDPNEGPNQGKIDLKTAGTLPLVGAMRLYSLKEGITATSTRNRMAQLHGMGKLTDDEADYLKGAHEHISHLLLRQQLEDHRNGIPVSNHVPVDALSKREKDMLIDDYKALRVFHKRLGKLVSV